MSLRSLIPFGGRRTRLTRPEFHSFASLQNEIDRLFEDFGRGLPAATSTAMAPSIDVSEADGEIEITAELPGLAGELRNRTSSATALVDTDCRISSSHRF